VEADGVLLIDRAGEATLLGYAEAAIWDLLTRGETSERIRAKLCDIASLEPAAAQALVRKTVTALRAAGLLMPGDSSG
jgi:hypothetical protein